MSGKQANLKDLIPVLQKVAKNEELENAEIVFKDITSKGDGYVGSINFIDITGTKNNQKTTLNVAVKCAPKNELNRENIPVRVAFLQEHYMYSTVLKEFYKFEAEHKVENKLTSIPKCYYSTDEEYNELLVFENLIAQGFKLKPIDMHMNDKHLSVTIAEYGKFHALSLAFKNKKPEVYAKLSEKLNGEFFMEMLDLSKDARNDFMRRMAKYLVEKGKSEVANSLIAYMENIGNYLSKFLLYRDKYSIMLHGDCWGNNFVFKYQDDKYVCPTDVRILDWQCSLYSSPAFDLGYFFWVGSHPDLYKDYKQYLQLYHNSFSEYLKQFGLDAEVIFPFDELLNQWFLGISFGLNMAFMVYKVMIIPKNEVPDFSIERKDEKSPMDFFYREFSNSQEHYAKCEKLIEFLHYEGLFKSAMESSDSLLAKLM